MATTRRNPAPIQNLLTIILGSAETLADLHETDPESYELASEAFQAAERGAQLTSRLLSFARLQPLSPEHRHPGELLAGIEGLIRRTIDEDIEIGIRVAMDVLPVEVDPGQLENAVLNLVINARDAMPDGGRLTIEAANVPLETEDLSSFEGMNAGQYVVIAVSDNGFGMSQDILERAFEPFFTSKEVGKGSGLGLSMVWGFVRQSNGYAKIYSEPGEGTTVKLYFPAATAKEQEAQVSDRAATVGLAGGTERILIVEDDELVRRHVAAQLGGLGYEIREAASASEGSAPLNLTRWECNTQSGGERATLHNRRKWSHGTKDIHAQVQVQRRAGGVEEREIGGGGGSGLRRPPGDGVEVEEAVPGAGSGGVRWLGGGEGVRGTDRPAGANAREEGSGTGAAQEFFFRELNLDEQIELVDTHREEHGLNACLRALGVSKGTWHYRKRNGSKAAEREASDRALREPIVEIIRAHPS